MSRNLTLHPAALKTQSREVWFEGTGALRKGVGVAYNQDYGTAANQDGERNHRTELLTGANHHAFAGVTTQAYAADANGQGIEIYEPGSVCEIAIGKSTVVDTTILGCLAQTGGNGIFWEAGFAGMKGSALAMQTTTIGGGANDAGGALDSTGLILTDAGQTYVTNGVVVGDILHILAGEDDGTNTVTAGEYAITAVTETTLTVGSVISDGGTMEVTYFITGTDKYVQAYLYTGEESSGCVECVQPLDNAASQSMVGGISYIHGGAGMANGNSTSTLADGVRFGAKKGFQLLVAMTTNDYVVTITSGQAIGPNPTTTPITTVVIPATLVFDGTADSAVLQWGMAEWNLLEAHGVAVTT